MADQETPIQGLNFLPIMFVLHSNSLASSTDAGGPLPATKSSIEALKTVSLEESENCKENECVVCLEGLFERDSEVLVKEMPCGHVYHGDCIEKWLKMHGSCPVCRFCMPQEEKKPVQPELGGLNGIWVSISFGRTED